MAALVPMDGFHLAQVELRRLDRAARKGAPDTFDVHGYIALLDRLRHEMRRPFTHRPFAGIWRSPSPGPSPWRRPCSWW